MTSFKAGNTSLKEVICLITGGESLLSVSAMYLTESGLEYDNFGCFVSSTDSRNGGVMPDCKQTIPLKQCLG